MIGRERDEPGYHLPSATDQWLPSLEFPVIVLGLVLLIVGFLLKVAILWTIGIILLLVGAVLLLLGSTGRAVGGRRHYW